MRTFPLWRSCSTSADAAPSLARVTGKSESAWSVARAALFAALPVSRGGSARESEDDPLLLNTSSSEEVVHECPLKVEEWPHPVIEALSERVSSVVRRRQYFPKPPE